MAHIQFEDMVKQHQQAPYEGIYILSIQRSGFLSMRDFSLKLQQKMLQRLLQSFKALELNLKLNKGQSLLKSPLLMLLQSSLLLLIRFIYISFILFFILTYNAYLQPISIVEAKEFRSLLLLLRDDLQEKDISHHTTMTKQILELQKEQVQILSANMLVS